MGGAPPANACEFIHQVIFCRMNDCFWPGVSFRAFAVKQPLKSCSLVHDKGSTTVSLL